MVRPIRPTAQPACLFMVPTLPKSANCSPKTTVSPKGSIHTCPIVKGEIIWAVQQEMARTIEDVLARRTRALLLNAKAALSMASVVAEFMATELQWNEMRKAEQLRLFQACASGFGATP